MGTTESKFSILPTGISSSPPNFFFFLIGKVKDLLKRDTKEASQSIEYLYTRRRNGQKRKRNIQTDNTKKTSTRAQPINKTN